MKKNILLFIAAILFLSVVSCTRHRSITPPVTVSTNTPVLIPTTTATTVPASDWIEVGPDSLPNTCAAWTSITGDSSGTLFVSYIDLMDGSKCKLIKYSASAWSAPVVLSSGSADRCSIAYDSGNVYVGYMDGMLGNRLTVKKYDGAAVSTVGTAGFSPGAVGLWQHAMTAVNGIVYIAFADESASGQPRVYKYETGAWSQAGGTVNSGRCWYACARYNSQDSSVYISFQTSSYGIEVRKLSAATWSLVGSSGFAGGIVEWPTMYIAGGKPFVAYTDWSNSKKVTAMTFNGSGWVNDGSAGFTPGQTYSTAFTMDGMNRFAVFGDVTSSNKTAVYANTGAGWSALGDTAFSAGGIEQPTIFAVNGVPYVVYQDKGLGYRMMVKKYRYALAANPTPVLTVNTYTPTYTHTNTATQTATYTSTSTATVTPAVTYGWETVDPDSLPNTASAWTSITGDCLGTLYVSYIDLMDGNKCKLIKFNGTDWSVPVVLSSGAADRCSIAYDSGNVYVGFMDGALSNKLTVKKYDGSAVTTLGTEGFTPGAVGLWQHALCAYNGTVYAAFADESASGQPRVYKYETGAWSQAGGTINSGRCWYACARYDQANSSLYVSFQKSSYGIEVRKLSGTTWNLVGSTGFSGGTVEWPSMYIYNGNPYVGYTDWLNSKKSSVMSFSGTTWSYQGTAAFSSGQTNSTCFTMDGAKMFTGFGDNTRSQKAAVYYNSGSGWNALGTPGFSTGAIEQDTIYACGGNVYLAYQDKGDGYKLIVKKYMGIVP